MNVKVFVAAAVLGVAASVDAGTISFDNASQLSEFTRNGDAATSLTYSSAAGIGSGGGVRSTSASYSSSSAIYSIGSSNALGSSMFVQLDYQMQFQGSGPDLRVGFTTSQTGTFNGPGDVWVETYGSGTPKAISANYDGLGTGFSSVPMIAGNWYRIRLELEHQTALGYLANAKVFDIGATGTEAPSAVSSQDFSFNSASLGSAPELFAGFFLYQQTSAADNFSASSVPGSAAVPTPAASMGGLALLGVLGLRRVLRAH